MAGLGYEVIRVPDHNGYNPYDPNCHYTYTNAFRVNDRIFIPVYGGTHADRDDEAERAWKLAAPVSPPARDAPGRRSSIRHRSSASMCSMMSCTGGP